MIPADDRLRLQHMLDAARRAVRFAKGRERRDLDDEDDPLASALVQRVTVIGEAAAKLGAETRSALEDIPWVDVTGMRNRLVHGYDDIDLDILWATIQDSLPPLIRELESVLAERDPP
jgi:uncharacterized protein with HEPN domain